MDAYDPLADVLRIRLLLGGLLLAAIVWLVLMALNGFMLRLRSPQR